MVVFSSSLKDSYELVERQIPEHCQIESAWSSEDLPDTCLEVHDYLFIPQWIVIVDASKDDHTDGHHLLGIPFAGFAWIQSKDAVQGVEWTKVADQ